MWLKRKTSWCSLKLIPFYYHLKFWLLPISIHHKGEDAWYWIVHLSDVWCVPPKAEPSLTFSFIYFFICSKRNCCARGAHVCSGRPWRMELFEHSRKVGPPGEAVELCGQYVHTTQHRWSHCSQWKVRNSFCPIFISLWYNFKTFTFKYLAFNKAICQS